MNIDKMNTTELALLEEAMLLMYEATDKLEVLYDRDKENFDEVFTNALSAANEIHDTLHSEEAF